MKKLRIANEKQFKEAVKILLISVVSITLTIVFAHYLRANGLESLFTTKIYQEAFETNPNDIKLINRIEVVSIFGILWMAYNELKSNAEMANLQRKEDMLCTWLLSH